MVYNDVSLSSQRLEYWFARSLGFAIVGDEYGPFALSSEGGKTITVFGSPESVKYSSFRNECADVVLEVAQSLGASFRIDGDWAVCQIGLIACNGEDYIHAALKVLVLRNSSGVFGPEKTVGRAKA